MLGTHRIVIQSKKIRYDFEINRNITVITGDSATGKTTLVSMIRDYYELGVNSGINVVCDKTCVVLEGRDWEERLKNIKDSIVFIDEGSKFVTSNHFASAVKHSDNYYVIITREKLSGLPYHINEVTIQQVCAFTAQKPYAGIGREKVIQECKNPYRCKRFEMDFCSNAVAK